MEADWAARRRDGTQARRSCSGRSWGGLVPLARVRADTRGCGAPGLPGRATGQPLPPAPRALRNERRLVPARPRPGESLRAPVLNRRRGPLRLAHRSPDTSTRDIAGPHPTNRGPRAHVAQVHALAAAAGHEAFVSGAIFIVLFRYIFGGAIDFGAIPYVDFLIPGMGRHPRDVR